MWHRKVFHRHMNHKTRLHAVCFKHAMTYLFFQEILFSRRVLQQAEKVTHEFVLDHQSYNSAKALYHNISNSLKFLTEVSFCFFKQMKDWVFLLFTHIPPMY